MMPTALRRRSSGAERGDRDEAEDAHEGPGPAPRAPPGAGAGSPRLGSRGPAWQSVERWTRRSSSVSRVFRPPSVGARRSELKQWTPRRRRPRRAEPGPRSGRRSAAAPPGSRTSWLRRIGVGARRAPGARDRRRLRDPRAVHDDRAGRSVVVAAPRHGQGRDCRTPNGRGDIRLLFVREANHVNLWQYMQRPARLRHRSRQGRGGEPRRV